uniref:Uncharacterized protein n=1 Tax=Myoviridae sp. ct1Js5 TaxID=2826601 RepID=A0A8S5M8Y8_9CAUD|nr:MAG TPA: hypothetical protein [Myoviridae sp. ct1Js5]
MLNTLLVQSMVNLFATLLSLHYSQPMPTVLPD